MRDREPRTKQTISMLERYRVMGYIEAHCIKGYGPDKKYAQWDDEGKSDQHVAEMFRASIANLNPDHVMRMRQEMDLLLEPSRWKFVAGSKEMEARIDQFEERFEAGLLKLSDRITALEEAVRRLEGRNTNPK